MLEGPVACDVIFSTSQMPTMLICCTNSCATKYPLFSVYICSAGPSQIGGSRRRMQRWFESAEGNRAQIGPAGKTERQAQQGLRIRGPFYGLLCSLQRLPFKELLHSCIWFQPTPANKTCVDGKSRSEIRRGKLALRWIARAIHHWTISMNYLRKTRRRGNKGLSTCFGVISALSLSVIRIIGRGSFVAPILCCLHFEFVLFIPYINDAECDLLTFYCTATGW